MGEKKHGLRRVAGYFVNHRLLNWMPDKPYLQIFYYAEFGKFIDFKNPKTFNEKLNWLKLYYRRPDLITLVDKYEVKKYIADKIGEQYVIPTLGVWDKFEDINFNELPNQFATLCKGLKIVAATVPVLVLLRHSKFSIRNLLLWGLIALLIIGNIFFNQADSDLIYIVIFILYCSKAEPESVLKTYCISAGIAIAIVIFAWLIGILPSQTSAGREYLGFYFATFGPNPILRSLLSWEFQHTAFVPVQKCVMIGKNSRKWFKSCSLSIL